jgi:zinc protease
MKWVTCGFAGSAIACWVLLTRVVLGDEESRKPQVPELKVEKYTLPNGLTVLLHEDHKTPVAAVDLYYKVGSKDEKPGRTGFAHLFEHMMFLGSKHHDEDFSRPLERLGAENNATTEDDRTEYYERVPSNALERALWLEADRMGFLLPSMTQEKLDKERDVVKNERRDDVDNAPYGQADEAIREALYPEGHPYRHSVLGSMVDLSAAGLADVSSFFRTFYAPDNAILCVAGDFEPEQARRWIARYFGPLPRGPQITPPRPAVPSLSAPKHIKLTDVVSLPRAQLIWPTVPAGHPDEPALDVLAAVLGGLDKENRLFRELMYDRQLAASVSASHPTHVLSGTFGVELYAHPDKKLEELVAIADAQIERLKREGPTVPEIRKAQNQRESELVMGLQSVIRKAAVFNEYEAVFGDPQAYRSELAKVFAVTPDDVRRVANQYLGANRIELDISPGDPMPRPPQADVAAKPNPAPAAAPAPVAVEIKDDFNRSAMPELGPTPRYQPPRFERRRLSNGLELRVVERPELPIVTVDLVVKSGETLAPIGKEGLATLAASLLEEGTKSRTSLQLAGELSEIGATLAAGASLESTTVSLTTLTRHLEHALDLFADVVKDPSFPDKELDRLKLQRLSHLKARTDDPEQTAAAVFPRLIYGLDHPYGRPDLGTPASVGSIIREDVLAFYRRIMVPSNAVLVVVGDVRLDAIAAALEARLSTWASGPVPPLPSLALMPTPPQTRTFYLIDRPGAAQSVLTTGRIGASRKSPDYSALVVLNAILGGQFESRLNANLRIDKGYSYGVNSSFSFDRGPGPFEAGGTVETTKTKESLIEMFKEMTDLSGSRPISDAELAFAKERIVLGFPSRFETTFGVAGQLATLITDELPEDEFDRYQARVEALTKADVDRVARQYITPETMTILVVGDRAKVEGPLKSLPFVKEIRRLDAEGNPLPDAPATGGQ